MADRSQTSTGLSVHLYGGLHKVLTLPANVYQKPILPVLLVLIRPFKTLQGRCRALKTLAFGKGLYYTAIRPCRLSTAV